MLMNVMIPLSTTAMMIQLVLTLLEASIVFVILDMKEMGSIVPVCYHIILCENYIYRYMFWFLQTLMSAPMKLLMIVQRMPAV